MVNRIIEFKIDMSNVLIDTTELFIKMLELKLEFLKDDFVKQVTAE